MLHFEICTAEDFCHISVCLSVTMALVWLENCGVVLILLSVEQEGEVHDRVCQWDEITALL